MFATFLNIVISSLIGSFSPIITAPEPLPEKIDVGQVSIVIDKPAFRLYVIGEKGDTISAYPVALGCNYGDKKRVGDRKTPDGNYEIVSIENASDWEGDASGSDYGPWFLRLGKGKWQHIGIHGTNRPEKVGTRASLGCIRLYNNDLEHLKRMVRVGTKVTILPDTIETFNSYRNYPSTPKKKKSFAGKETSYKSKGKSKSHSSKSTSKSKKRNRRK